MNLSKQELDLIADAVAYHSWYLYVKDFQTKSERRTQRKLSKLLSTKLKKTRAGKVYASFNKDFDEEEG